MCINDSRIPSIVDDLFVCGVVRINFFGCICLHFDGYKYFVERVNFSSHRSKKLKVSNERRFITFSLAVQTAPIIRSKHSRAVRTVQGVAVGIF